jgi:hypothetical protein
MIYEQKMVDEERVMISGLAYLLSVHVCSSQKTGDGRYPTWDSFTNTFYAEHNRTWHEAVGDSWGGLIVMYSECGAWPKIRELDFNTGVSIRGLNIDLLRSQKMISPIGITQF